MPTFVLTYRDSTSERIEADDCWTDNGWLVFVRHEVILLTFIANYPVAGSTVRP